MDYINGKLTGISSANDLEKKIAELEASKQDKLTVVDHTTYITLTIDGVSYNLTKATV